jgi:hypothetical protein
MVPAWMRNDMKPMHMRNSSFTCLLRWVAGRGKMLSALVFMLSIMFIITIGCNINSVNTSSPDLFFPVQKEGLAQMLISAKGRLVLDNNCLCLKPIIGHSYLLIWPYGSSLRIEGKVIEVVNRDGKALARVGDVIKVGGGEAVSAEIVEIYIGYSLPPDCKGPYWLVSEVVQASTPIPPLNEIYERLKQIAENRAAEVAHECIKASLLWK